MPIQDLPDTPTALPDGGVRALLRDIGAEDEFGTPPWPWTGCLHLEDAATGRSADLYLQDGGMYAAHMTGYIPPVALRLRSAGCLDDEQFDEYAAMNPADVGPTVIQYGLAPQVVVEEIHREIMLATVSHLYEWEFASWVFDEDAATGDYVTAGVPLLLVVAAVDERIGQWRAVTRAHPHVVQPTAIPHAGPAWAEKAGAAVEPELAALLGYVDGRANIAQIASQCGFTRFETARLLTKASADGVLVFTAAPTPIHPPATTPDMAPDAPTASGLVDLGALPPPGPVPPLAALPGTAAEAIHLAREHIRVARNALNASEANLDVAAALLGLAPAPAPAPAPTLRESVLPPIDADDD